LKENSEETNDTDVANEFRQICRVEVDCEMSLSPDKNRNQNVPFLFCASSCRNRAPCSE